MAFVENCFAIHRNVIVLGLMVSFIQQTLARILKNLAWFQLKLGWIFNRKSTLDLVLVISSFENFSKENVVDAFYVFFAFICIAAKIVKRLFSIDVCEEILAISTNNKFFHLLLMFLFLNT